VTVPGWLRVALADVAGLVVGAIASVAAGARLGVRRPAQG